MQVEVRCSVCSAVAARFAARRAGEGEGLLGADDRLERVGWFGVCVRPMRFDDARAWVARIGANPLVELAGEDPDLFGFVCRRCGVAYCSRCWHVGVPEMDEGFYDCTRGTCPNGHEQTLDD